MEKSKYVPPAVTFDGEKDHLTRGSDLTGTVDGTKGTLSLRVAGCEAVDYLEPGEYLDLSDEAVRRTFINKDGEPIVLIVPHGKSAKITDA